MEFKGKSLKYLLLIPMLLFSVIAVHVPQAQETTLVYVAPCVTTANLGESFTVDVNVADVGDLFSWAIKMRWNSTVLKCTNVIEGPFLEGQPAGTYFIYKLYSDYIDVACVTLGAYPGVSGNGTLMTVTFLVEDYGTSLLNVYDDILLDSTLSMIPHETADGYFSNFRDVAVTDVTPLKNVVGQGYNLGVNVTVANQGDLTETFNVTAYYNETAVILPDEKNYTTITLASGNSSTVTFTWNTTGVAYGNYTLSANVTEVPGEIDVSDNVFTDGVVLVTISGDVNGDRKVRIDDLLAVVLAFGSNCGDPGYDPNLDITDDCKIRIDDVLIVASHFGLG